MAFFKQLGLLLWKNGLQQWRKKCVTVCEILVPLILATVLMSLRFTTDKPIRYPSSGGFNKGYGWFTTYLRHTTVVYTPNTTLINKLVTNIVAEQNVGRRLRTAITLKGFENTEDMLAYVKAHPADVTNAIEFMDIRKEDKHLPKQLRFAIRPRVDDSNEDWKTTQLYPSATQWMPRPDIYPEYEFGGFLTIQRLIYEGVIKYWNPNSTDLLDGLNINLYRMPYPPYTEDRISRLNQEVLPALILLSFIFIAVQTTKDIVDEKEKKLKETMKLMGLSSAAHWTSWFLFRFIQMAVIMGLFTVFCCVDMSGKGAPLLNSDPSVIFVFLICYGVAIISFCFMISVFVNKGSTGAAISGIVFFVSYCPYMYIAYAMRFRNLSLRGAQGFCLIFNLGMALGAYLIGLYEGFGTGVQWSNMYNSPEADNNFSLLDCMLLLLMDAAVHLIITWYVDNVRPGEYGVPKPWNFPFKVSYWCGSGEKYPQQMQRHVQQEDINADHGISIRALRKVYGSGAKRTVAVDGMDLDVTTDQITVLLGQNGAGKTTTISILTGFIPPSEGTAVVNGYDVRTEISSVRQSLGLCPQHNILFDTLTVQEHLEFFTSLKGCGEEDQKLEVEKMIQEVGLANKRNTQSQHLSGGQKRKLSVGIALIGGSKIVILDEPTSGMDPAARRQTWDILQRNRQGRTMLLTTHFMDEADLLGDRIAIMAEGVVRCSGTSYELKNRYGAGYHLIMEKKPSCQETLVTSAVQRHIPTAKLESETNSELSFLLPGDESAKFADLFKEIEESSDLEIASYGITTTTMEEVFMKVINEKDNRNGTSETPGRSTEISMDEIGSADNKLQFQSFNKLAGCALELSRFKGLLTKKFLHTWRNRVITLVQFLLPLPLVIFALAIARSSTNEEVALTLDLSPFQGTDVPFWRDNSTDPLGKSFEKAYSGQFIGTPNKFEDVSNFTNTTGYFLQMAETFGLDYYNKKIIVGVKYYSQKELIAFYNEQPYHAEPIAQSYLMNAILKLYTSQDYSITTIIHPLPSNIRITYSEAIDGVTSAFIIAFCIFFGMAFLTSSFVHLPIKERNVGAKHLQLLSGVRPFIFWTSNFVWDFINYIVPVLLILVLFEGFQIPAYTDDGRLRSVFLILVLYGVAIIPFMYTLQYLFTSPATGTVVMVILNICTGLATLMAVYMFNIADQVEESKTLDWVFSVIFPHHNLGRCFENMYVIYINLEYCIGQNYSGRCSADFVDYPVKPCCKDRCKDECFPVTENYMGWESPGIGRYIIFMCIHAVVFTTSTFIIEYRIPQRLLYILQPKRLDISTEKTDSEDEDIIAERSRVNNLQIGHEGSDPLVLKNLSKYYGKYVAVDNLSVGIPEKECFGLLGQNGAGKTSTFKMLTGDLMITLGNAYLRSDDVKNNTRAVQENMGYCPQFDALIDQMTGRETLTMYARLKGVPEDRIRGVCDNLLESLYLTQYSDKLTSEYSGGNRRKLSTAIALVGNPDFIMLDEPSTGMDPKARRQLWNVLSQVRTWGRTLVLTSHSMEECEALCTKLAIMMNGRFMCLGTPQHLKIKFGQGYTLIARMAMLPDGQTTASNQPLVDFIGSNFPESQVFDDHQGYVHFQVPYISVSLAQVFTVMEQAKAQHSVEDYSVHQTTLEQVFLKLTLNQTPPRETRIGFLKRICC